MQGPPARSGSWKPSERRVTRRANAGIAAVDLTQQARILTAAGTEGGTTIPITAGAEGDMASVVGPDTEEVLYTVEDSGGFQVGRGLIVAGHLISAYALTIG